MTKRKTLSTIVSEALGEKIQSGALRSGAQLPTEAELCAEFDVSRTVVREAVARLRSDGLVVPHQGKGMFVSDAPAKRGFSIPPDALKSLPETIALLELRLSLEVESAGLSAERRTIAEAASIRSMMEQVDARHADPGSVQIHYDYDFHLAIAKSSRNAYIFGFLQYLRPMIVPKFQLGYVVPAEQKDRYYDRIHAEHQKIVEAIEAQDSSAARNSMRKHLANSLQRVRGLAPAAGIETAKVGPDVVAQELFAGIGAKLSHS